MMSCTLIFAQHNNEFYNNGALVHLDPGAEVHVWGDVHMYGTTGVLDNNGLIKTQGHSYSDANFQQTGTGTYRIENSDVNVGERQGIYGSYAVRGGQTMTGVDDGSFFNLELANDQGIVFVSSFSQADVRNDVDFWAGTVHNRVVTHTVPVTGAITYPANGVAYNGTFGVMNPVAGTGSTNSATAIYGNMSAVDAGYIQGNLRRAIAPTGGLYGFGVGLEPAGAGAQRGFQFIRLNFAANTYDVMYSYFQTASPNVVAGTPIECSGNTIAYFGGADHGEWFFQDQNAGAGTGNYEVTVYPQDDNFPAQPMWVITNNDQLLGTANMCGPTPVGLNRTGYNVGIASFGVAAPITLLPIELIDINATGIVDHIDVTWNVASEINLSHYELERSENGVDFEYIATLNAAGNSTSALSYSYSDFEVRPIQNYYYRVKSVDLDGSEEYTPVVVASIEGGLTGFDESAVSIFPNPTANDFMLSIASKEDREVTVTLFNPLGQIVEAETKQLPAGNTIMKFSLEEKAYGIYLMEIRDTHSNETITKRIIKQ